MKNSITFFLLFAVSSFLTISGIAQPIGFYNGTEGKSGDALKQVLHDKINNHVDFSYNQAKYLINYSDADPENPANVILFYSQISRNASLYGSVAGTINREHVWAKSHGNFSGIRPMDGDALNLRPADAIVNMNRGNLDFDNVQPNGVRDQTATSCWYSESAYEPGPLTKGQVARILFYMATR
ncbi:MAG: endonuclease [Prolixibacteraceae bacterium]|nr:endonuclease [Prolixibacteraceae bacterium]